MKSAIWFTYASYSLGSVKIRQEIGIKIVIFLQNWIKHNCICDRLRFNCVICKYDQLILRLIEIRMQQQPNLLERKKSPPSRLSTANPLYLVQKFLRETASVNRFKAINKVSHPESFFEVSRTVKHLPYIVTKMKQNKQQLETILTKNHIKLNSSFSQYFRNGIHVNQDMQLKRKITKLKKIQDQREKMIEAPPVQRDQNAFVQTTFKLFPLPNRCFDSLFPAIRYNATLFGSEKQVYLLGGYHQRGFQGLSLFHKYDYQLRKWIQIKGQGEAPKISPCFHTVQIFKNNLIIVGGVSFQGEKGKRFNTQLLIFNMQKSQWLRARGGLNIKHHASTLFGSTLMINGGINEKQKFNEQLIFITFTGGNLINPLIFTVKNQGEAHQKISRHKIIQTYDLQTNYRNQIKYDGILSFGGQDQNGTLNNDIMFINVLGKVSQNLDIKFKKWQIIITNEDKPCPRKDHSFNIINKKGIAILAGGIQEYGNWLDDVWLLDLVRMNWTRVNTSPKIEESLGTLAGHCACAIGTTVYFYNGNVEKKREKAFWMLETDASNYKSKKNMYATKLPSFKSIHSQKENYSMTQI